MTASLAANLPTTTPAQTTPGSFTRSRTETYVYDSDDRLIEQVTPERKTQWTLDAVGRRIKQLIAAIAVAGTSATALASANGLEALSSSANATIPGTLTYSYNERDQLTEINADPASQNPPGQAAGSGHPAKIVFTYDANGNRTGKVETRTTVPPASAGNYAATVTTTYRWNAQDQLVRVERSDNASPTNQPLASYRYNPDNLRTEKSLTALGISQASRTSQGIPALNPPTSERIQWDGMHARRHFSVDGTSNAQQNLISDTDAANGASAPRLLTQTRYANAQTGQTSTVTTQLHSDSLGSLIASVINGKADSFSVFTAYGLVDAAQSGNAANGSSGPLQSNSHSYASYFADPETGLLYARARYFDPATGQFIGRDPVEGEPDVPATWLPYVYGRGNPYRYTDPNGDCDDLRECATQTAGGVTGALGLTAVKAVEGLVDLAKLSADGYLGLIGNEAAQARNQARSDTLTAIYNNADKIPAALKQALVNIDNKAAAEDKAGNTFTAAMLRGNYAAEITLALASIPQTARSAGNLIGRVAEAGDTALAALGNRSAAARTIAREIESVEPVIAANRPTPITETATARPKVDTTNPVLIVEGRGLSTAGEMTSTVRSALPVESATAEAAIRAIHESRSYQRFSENARSGARRDLDLTINERGLIAQERVQAEAAGWKRADGKTWWPDYDGAMPGTQRAATLSPTTNPNVVDRYGDPKGSYVSPAGVPMGQRAMRSVPSEAPHIYDVTGTIPNVEVANAIPWFGQQGLGRQIKLPTNVQKQLHSGNLTERLK
jgi:RHS repeat-associated protein